MARGKSTGEKIKKTPDQRFALKLDKIISSLIQMKPLCNNSEKKTFVYGKLRECLEYQQTLPE